jgi:hypothetical protein
VLAGSLTAGAFAADREIKVEDRLEASADTLTEMMKADDRGIPQGSTKRIALLSCPE